MRFLVEFYDFLLPIGPLYLTAALLTMSVIWVRRRTSRHSDGPASLLRCAFWAGLIPIVFLIRVCLWRLFFFLRVFGSLSNRESGTSIYNSLFGLDRSSARSYAFLFLLIGCGAFFVLRPIGLDPEGFDHRLRMARHGALTRDAYFAAVMAGMVDKLEGQYNVGFHLPDQKQQEVRFQIRSFDGRISVYGDLDSAFDETRCLSPQEALDHLTRVLHILDGSLVLSPAEAEKELNRFRNPDKQGIYGEWVHHLTYNVPASVQELYSKEIPKVLPAPAIIQQLRDWKRSGADGVTTPTAQTNPAAWDFALNEQDLAVYHATPDPKRLTRGDYRDRVPESETAARLWTVVQQVMTTPQGDITILLEVHKDPSTAAADVYGNKVAFPAVGKDYVTVLIPQLTYDGDQYFALVKESNNATKGLFAVMEGFYRNIWYRITAPVSPSSPQNNDMFRLLNMQKYKVFRMLKKN